MPTPRKGETKSSFIGRCIPIVKREGAKQEHAVGKCHGIWRGRGKKPKKNR